MVRPDFREITYQNELYHYGIKGKSGRYPLGSGERPYQDYPEKRFKRREERLHKKFDKIDKKIDKTQQEANKYFQAYTRKRNSRFPYSEDKLASTLDRAKKLQGKAENIQYKGSQAYKKYEKMAKTLNKEMDKELKERGLKYYNNTIKNSKGLYDTIINESAIADQSTKKTRR